MTHSTNQVELEQNALGRMVPTVVNGRRQLPYAGTARSAPRIHKAAPPVSSAADYPNNGDKRVRSLVEALEACGLRDGMTISTHHHFRNGDIVSNLLFDTSAKLGVRDLVWSPSAAFPCHEPIIRHMEEGVVHHVEGSLNGSLGAYCSKGRMRGLGVLRSHGGRWQAIQDGEIHIDIAVIAAPCADAFGNANGVNGPAACGSLNFALADSVYADKVIVVTDCLVPFPAVPWQIQGNNVDYVVEVDRVGDPSKIVSGNLEITKNPDELSIAELAARFVRDSGIMKDGFSFQAGAGGIALAFVIHLKHMMKEAGVRARFVRGGSTKYLVEMLDENLTDYILDGQTFDLAGIVSMRHNSRHIATSPFTSYNYHGKGFFGSFVDAVVLGATEVDLDFNANVVTHSDGRLFHGIGGWQNCLFSPCTILTIPTVRRNMPVIVEEVTTLTGPGNLIDVIVTERGICINPLREDLQEAVKDKGLPLRDIHDLCDEARTVCGGSPKAARRGTDVVAAVKWVDGTVMDTIWKVE